MNKGDMMKVLGLTATAIGLVTSLVTDWVNAKILDERMDQKISEALAKQKD